ncbi:MAG: hypothetical protein R3B90_17150 [Planctomycetaceae bacterium]
MRDPVAHFRGLIRETRELFGDAPREFGFLQKFYLKARPPSWCTRGNDAMWINYRDQWRLLTEGNVVWAAFVQANRLMFEPGRHDCPGTVIYSRDRKHGDELIPLLEAVPRLFELKGAYANDAECQRYGDMLADERERAMGLTVPQIISEGVPMTSTSVVFHRKHLPTGYLTCNFFPLLILPDQKSCMLLPSRFWSPTLIEHWQPRKR